MARWIAAAFVLAEVAGFALVGRWLGVAATLLLVVAAALAGGMLLRRRGGDVLRALGPALRAGRDPVPLLLRGGFGVAAGLLLVAPGFLSDIVALLLLLPPVQRLAAGRLAARARVASRPGATVRVPSRPDIPDAEWEEVAPPRARPDPRPDSRPDDPRPGRPPSGWTRH